ncbi:MAG: membrane protein insertase YidC [Alphaproteobacteria bacterium]|nr:membrane protein insertase YidC [Alphaproteobacteria bacterium]
MKEETKSLYLAVFVSILIIFGVNHFFAPKMPPKEAPKPEKKVEIGVEAVAISETVQPKDVDEIVSSEARVLLKNSSLDGSVRLKGARFDFLKLVKYKQTLEENSENVELFAPIGSIHPYFAEFGFLSSENINLPNADTLWTAKGDFLTPTTPLTLEWTNGQGLKFVRKISIDEHYLITIDQTVENNTARAVVLYPYGRIWRDFGDAAASQSVVHEGITAVIDGALKEFKLKDIKEGEPKTFETKESWAGFSDRYWFSALILDASDKNTLKFSKTGEKAYQIDYMGAPISIESGKAHSNTVRLFAGAKEIKLLDRYAKKGGIQKFDLAIDFGWYYFLTKPFFYILDFLYALIGNMGWAILVFAALLRLLMFPIANKSYESMSKMRKIQPKVQEIQQKYQADKVLLQQKTMELYKKEKINPASGCLPMFIQIPIFFSLYKVLNIAIEIRHAPFIGWIKDLSAPDPLTISAWSHIPLPALLDIGVWPILMGLTMWFQQKLNPAPTNKDQARMFALMPFIFTIMLGHFASGLVIYWTLSNILSIVQQRAIMFKNGVK